MENKPDFFDVRYNDESNLIENLYEFHPEYFDKLSAEEFSTLQKYYLFTTPATDFPENVFAYRNKLLQHSPTLEEEARTIYTKIIHTAGIEN